LCIGCRDSLPAFVQEASGVLTHADLLKATGTLLIGKCLEQALIGVGPEWHELKADLG
jgi:hypothetical protein